VLDELPRPGRIEAARRILKLFSESKRVFLSRESLVENPSSTSRSERNASVNRSATLGLRLD
jgi:hypothetical protein